MWTTEVGDGDRRSPARRQVTFRLPLPRRRKMVVVRLGGSTSRRGWRGRGRRILAGLVRRMRLRWLSAKYMAALKRLRACQAVLLRDLIEGAASMEAVNSGLMMEPYFAAGSFLPVGAVNCLYARP